MVMSFLHSRDPPFGSYVQGPCTSTSTSTVQVQVQVQGDMLHGHAAMKGRGRHRNKSLQKSLRGLLRAGY
jgi:hypothetical protein